MGGHGVDLVLGRLAHFGCDPRSAGEDTWQAQCPAHGGPYPALLVSRRQDGSVTLHCRNVDHQGRSCSQTDLWESIKLDPRQFAGAQAGVGPPEHASEARGHSSPATNGHGSAPGRAGPSHDAVNPSSIAESAATSSASRAQEPAGAGEVAQIAAEQTASPDPAASQPSDLPQAAAIVAVSPEPPAHGDVAPGELLPRKDDSHAEMLMRIASKGRIFRGSDNRFYAQVPVGGHHEICELGSSSFERWLNRTFRQNRQALPTLESINRLVRASEADAAAMGSIEPVWVRVAAGGGRIVSQRESANHVSETAAGAADGGAVYYLDLGDSSRAAVEIRAGECHTVTAPPVSFRRPRGLRPLPQPRWDGSIDAFKKYTNVTDADFPLLVAWMTAALHR